jgi:hypothetical protein
MLKSKQVTKASDKKRSNFILRRDEMDDEGRREDA